MAGNATYVDIYLLPVPETNLGPYQRQAAVFGQAAIEHGALTYREFRGDDLDERFSAERGDGELLTAAIAEFRSRQHRDEVMAKVMADPRVTEQMEGEQLADMTRMRYGGFERIVDGGAT